VTTAAGSEQLSLTITLHLFPESIHPSIEGDRRPTASASSARSLLPQPGEIALPWRLEHATAE
jgi:hypothetical protein